MGKSNYRSKAGQIIPWMHNFTSIGPLGAFQHYRPPQISGGIPRIFNAGLFFPNPGFEVAQGLLEPRLQIAGQFRLGCQVLAKIPGAGVNEG